MASMEPRPAAACSASASWKRRVYASGARKVDCRLRTAQRRAADAIAGQLARAAHRNQTLSLYGGEFPAAPARAVGRRSQTVAGSAGRGARSGCAVVNCRRDHGVSRYGKPAPVAGEVECGALAANRKISREDGWPRIALARVASRVARGRAVARGGAQPLTRLGRISRSRFYAFPARCPVGSSVVRRTEKCGTTNGKRSGSGSRCIGGCFFKRSAVEPCAVESRRGLESHSKSRGLHARCGQSEKVRESPQGLLPDDPQVAAAARLERTRI